jgi:hypothetical protein
MNRDLISLISLFIFNLTDAVPFVIEIQIPIPDLQVIFSTGILDLFD